jgi:hypothetical protein
MCKAEAIDHAFPKEKDSRTQEVVVGKFFSETGLSKELPYCKTSVAPEGIEKASERKGWPMQ